jgi:hypothetical protein
VEYIKGVVELEEFVILYGEDNNLSIEDALEEIHDEVFYEILEETVDYDTWKKA